jgi:hypothetical protein
VEHSRYAIHPGDGAVGADVHLEAHKFRWSSFAQLGPTGAGEKGGHDEKCA